MLVVIALANFDEVDCGSGYEYSATSIQSRGILILVDGSGAHSSSKRRSSELTAQGLKARSDMDFIGTNEFVP